MTHPKTAELQKALDDWQHFSPCLGVNVSIRDGEQDEWHAASGLQTLNPDQPLTPNAPFFIYSITKTFTAALVMLLVEEGKVALDDAITKYLADLSLPDTVTVRRLLNHTSGVPSYTDLDGYVPATQENPGSAWDYDHVRQLTCEGELDFAPGEGWHYSNTGYMLLKRLIETVTGMSFAECLRQRICTPLGLDDTYAAEAIAGDAITPGYCRQLSREGRMENIRDIYDPGWCLTGLIVSTAKDVSGFYQALFNEELVSPTSLKTMTAPVPINQNAGPHFKNPCYGLGLMIDPEAEHGGSFGHGGSGPGFNTWSVHYPDFEGRPIFVTVLCNTSMGAHPFYLVKDLLRVLA